MLYSCTYMATVGVKRLKMMKLMRLHADTDAGAGAGSWTAMSSRVLVRRRCGIYMTWKYCEYPQTLFRFRFSISSYNYEVRLILKANPQSDSEQVHTALPSFSESQLFKSANLGTNYGHRKSLNFCHQMPFLGSKYVIIAFLTTAWPRGLRSLQRFPDLLSVFLRGGKERREGTGYEELERVR